MRRETEGNADVWTWSVLRVGDMFGFDYNEMAVSTFRQISLEKRQQSGCCITSESSVPPLPFLRFCLLCCSNSLMKRKQKCFLFSRRSKAALHTMPTSACVCVCVRQNFWLMLKLSFSFCHLTISTCRCISLWSRILGFQRPELRWQKHLSSVECAAALPVN